MTPWSHWETFTDQSQDMKLPTIQTVVSNCDMPQIMPQMDFGVAVHGDVRSSRTSQRTAIVFVVDDDASVCESLELLICNIALLRLHLFSIAASAKQPTSLCRAGIRAA